jgi:hypothetical protein
MCLLCTLIYMYMYITYMYVLKGENYIRYFEKLHVCMYVMYLCMYVCFNHYMCIYTDLFYA